MVEPFEAPPRPDPQRKRKSLTGSAARLDKTTASKHDETANLAEYSTGALMVSYAEAERTQDVSKLDARDVRPTTPSQADLEAKEFELSKTGVAVIPGQQSEPDGLDET